MNELILCELRETSIPGLESYSPFCLKVHRVLRVLNLPYTSRHADNPADFRALNPASQVPVLLLGNEAIADSTNIVAKLRTLAPGLNVGFNEREEGEAYAWEEFADTVLNGFLVAARWSDDENWSRVRLAYFGSAPWFVRSLIAPRLRANVMKSLLARDVLRSGAAACWERFERTLDALEARAPQSGYWMKETISTADLSIFAQLHSLRTPLTEKQRRSVERRSHLTAWLDRIDRASRRVHQG